MKFKAKYGFGILIFTLALAIFLSLTAGSTQPDISSEKNRQISDHFDGTLYFNPDTPQPSSSGAGQIPSRGRSWWIWRFIFGTDWPEWPEMKDLSPGPAPIARLPQGSLRITPVGHATFLIQIDGLNILTDPIWSDRCSPVAWRGPKRHKQPAFPLMNFPHRMLCSYT
jgi:hypothetical protein